MTLSRIGRFGMAFVVSVAMGLGVTSCGGRTIGYMWVLGTQANAAAGQQSGQIVGYKIDNFTGNLTSAVGSPFTSGGTNPVSIVVKPGGRYVYVVNKGVPTTNPTSCSASVVGNIQVLSVGGDGTLTPQSTANSQGCTPVWAEMSASGDYLYVLDKLSPAYGKVTNGVTDLNGDITVFAVAADTGRLSLVTNAQVKDPSGNQLTYFEVGPTPIMMRSTGGGCLFTVNQGNSTVFPYSVGASGQLTLTTNSTIQVAGPTTPLLTSIATNGANVYFTDAANNLILPYQVGTSCALNTLTGGSVPNLALTSNPQFGFVESTGSFLYILNQSGTNSNNANSTVSAFKIDSATSKLSPVVGDVLNPYSIGAGPVCMGEDPTSQYLYTSNGTAGTVTGKQINKQTGQLSDLARGATFPSTGHATCLVISGNVQ
ncbi:MAG: beta-propeller fold lactonase family protein [Granulicella sp.]